MSRRAAFAGLEVACLLATGCVRPRATTESTEVSPQGTEQAPVASATTGAGPGGTQPAGTGQDAQDAQDSPPDAPAGSGPPMAGASPSVGPAAGGPSPQSARAPGQVEALRLGGDVLMLEPRGTWTVLAATHTVEGGRARVVLRTEVDPFGPRNPASVAWIEASAPLAADQLVGTWAVSGSIPGPGGAIGWRREYRLADDGGYTFSAYPALTGEGTWRQREAGSPLIVLRGHQDGEAVALRRDTAREPSAPGPVALERVQVTQTDAPPPPPPSDTPSLGPVDPIPAGPPRPPRTTVTDLRTDAQGALEVVLEPWARQLILVDPRQRRVSVAL